MFRWLNGPGAAFRDPLPGSTNYLNAYDPQGNLIRARAARATNRSTGEEDPRTVGEEGDPDGPDTALGRNHLEQNIAGGKPIPKEMADDLMPFPLNRQFRSQPVLSEELRDEIYRRIHQEKKTVRTVSAELGVEMQRVGAVFRLKTIENQWIEEGKPLAAPYARAVGAMLPKTPFVPGTRTPPLPHESINDLPVHSATTRQLFHPVPESMHFNRESAARAFSRDLLPADKRIPHPELVELAKVAAQHRGRDDVVKARRNELEQQEAAVLNMRREQKAAQEAAAKKVDTPRWQFRFENIKAESAGRDGRAKGGVGARYGIPAQDRKKGQIKIPTKVQ
ncbi:MAG: hypothetical protein LQ337_003098 [Flavoplaca oasis]|nr:MAG: hypothetical protein LQ337_003098 [Flavoplaca oasis]